jgi:hypothetical protein
LKNTRKKGKSEKEVVSLGLYSFISVITVHLRCRIYKEKRVIQLTVLEARRLRAPTACEVLVLSPCMAGSGMTMSTWGPRRSALPQWLTQPSGTV